MQKSPTQSETTRVEEEIAAFLEQKGALDAAKTIEGIRSLLRNNLSSDDYFRLGVLMGGDRLSEKPVEGETLHEVIPQIAEEHPGRAAYLFKRDELIQRMESVNESLLPGRNKKVLYAAKANSQNHVLQALKDGGVSGFDCASSNEALAAFMVGMDAEQVYFNLPKNPPKDLVEILSFGAKYVTVDHPKVLNRVLETCRVLGIEDAEIAVRLAVSNPHATLKMASKFGLAPEHYSMAVPMLDTIKAEGLKASLCFNAGSQITDPAAHAAAIALTADIAREADGVSSINMGGGLPIDYYGDLECSGEDIIQAINEAIEKNIDASVWAEDEQFIFEFGRYLVAPTITWVSPIHAIEKRGNESHISFRGGIHSIFNGVRLHEWPLPPMRVIASNGEEKVGAPEEFVLSGETCNPIDRLETLLPGNIAEGDYLVFENAGAYTDSYGSNFNGHMLPEHVLWNRP